MTTIKEGVSVAKPAAVEGLDDGNSRYQHVCKSLGGMLPIEIARAGGEVIACRVEGYNRISTVTGNVIATVALSGERGAGVTDMVLQPTNNRDPDLDLSIFEDLNAMGDAWRQQQAR